MIIHNKHLSRDLCSIIYKEEIVPKKNKQTAKTLGNTLWQNFLHAARFMLIATDVHVHLKFSNKNASLKKILKIKKKERKKAQFMFEEWQTTLFNGIITSRDSTCMKKTKAVTFKIAVLVHLSRDIDTIHLCTRLQL